MRVGLLSRFGAPALPFILAAMRVQGIRDLVVIRDELAYSQKDRDIWQGRTGGAFERVPGVSLDAFPDVPFYQVKNHNECADFIRELKIDLLFNASTPRKLKPDILTAAPHGVVNVHPGLLPEYRGSCCVEWAIYNNDPVGNTAHFMTEEYDAGPIILSEWYEFPSDADYVSVRVRTFRDGFLLGARAVAMVIESRITPSSLPPQGEGRLWKPIPSELLEAAKDRLARGNYRFARL